MKRKPRHGLGVGFTGFFFLGRGILYGVAYIIDESDVDVVEILHKLNP